MVILNEERLPSLLTYKYYIRPNAHRLYGDYANRTKHQQNVHRILKILALNGPMTTWDMAKIRFPNDIEKIRSKEKEYRRLLVGRTDRGRHSDGILGLKLVLIDSISTKRNPGNKYRLSLFGILYCLDRLHLEKFEVDKMAKNYAVVLPLVFGNWDLLKSIIGDNVYNLSLLGKGLLFDNLHVLTIDNSEFYELIMFFNIKSNQLSQSLNETKIGELISLWFYITLLYFPNLKHEKKRKPSFMLKQIFKKRKNIEKWFLDYVDSAKKYYKERSNILEDVSFT
ncbi:hypothetical protein NsoK4_04815 [Nitrosopumilus sp. K4]|uniref:hypothetical protein n=1 Tax=Nitrosopumilus sp. K4 TaxID=2795383 RepID=UPI001BA865A5|nr:hypothetical protein [Nitrosopumilus sp. K4]QUC65559.1 hypothetical protein NsoK4_04815 [Nitrosopumilus sp. K4]